MLRYEKDCYHAVRDAGRETEEIGSRRSESAKSIRLDKGVFETVSRPKGSVCVRSDVDLRAPKRQARAQREAGKTRTTSHHTCTEG